MKRTAALATAAIAILLSGCAGSSVDDATDADSGSGAEAARTTAGESPAGGVRAASCIDAAADGGPADLTSVKLVEGGEGLRATFTLTAPLNTSTGTALLSLLVSSQDGETARQLGVKWIDGQSEVFVFDSASAQNEYVDVPPVVDGSTVKVAFPRSAVDGLGDTWRWGATSSVDGTDVDDCPAPGDDVLNPERQPFPG